MVFGEAVAQASCLWGRSASRLPITVSQTPGRMPGDPTAKMAVLPLHWRQIHAAANKIYEKMLTRQRALV